MNTLEILTKILKIKSSDFHLKTGKKPIYRNVSGEIETLEDFEVFTQENLKEILKKTLGEEKYHTFEQKGEIDGSYTSAEKKRYRVNAFKNSAGISLALRSIPHQVPSMQALGLGEQIKEMTKKSKGLILVTGPTGSGKSTNMAAMIDYINQEQKKHIITLEDPIEFSFSEKNSLIDQREIGTHSESFSNAMRASLREDPDIIMLGEMRDPETIKSALTLAETGHLVISTLHTNDAVQTVDRIIDSFPAGEQDQIRMQLSQSLVGVISQRLLPKKDQSGRIAAREILITNDAVKNLIITGKTHQLYSVLEVSAKDGMILMDKYLKILFQKGHIDKETLLSYARNKESIEMSL